MYSWGGFEGGDGPAGEAVHGVGEEDRLLGAGEPHVEEAPFLGEFPFLLLPVLPGAAGEQSVLHPGDEDAGEFQALGGVEGHEVRTSTACGVFAWRRTPSAITPILPWPAI